MTPHTHTEHVAGCYRCELSRDEVSAIAKRDCTKIAYPTKVAAYVDVARVKSARPQRAYRCPWCRAWHITTQPDRNAS